ncbi:hypothetical protein D9M71_713580 [compost metagenome]
MVFQQFLHDLDPPGELDGAGLGLQQVRQHQRVDGAMLFLGFVIHLRFLLAAGLLDGRVQDFFFQSGVDGHLPLDTFEQLGAFLHRALSGGGQLLQ